MPAVMADDHTQLALFADDDAHLPASEAFADGATLLRGFVDNDREVIEAIRGVTEKSPFRHMVTPGGLQMSARLTSCGAVGWVSDRHGYRYEACDPLSGLPWPGIPAALLDLAGRAAAAGGYAGFEPDACLVNEYQVGARMSLHQDRDERDFSQPIVSVSLGLPATFVFGGLRRTDPVRRLRLKHGDVVVWGGPTRLNFHGILPISPGHHPVVGARRINLTFRRAR